MIIKKVEANQIPFTGIVELDSSIITLAPWPQTVQALLCTSKWLNVRVLTVHKQLLEKWKGVWQEAGKLIDLITKIDSVLMTHHQEFLVKAPFVLSTPSLYAKMRRELLVSTIEKYKSDVQASKTYTRTAQLTSNMLEIFVDACAGLPNQKKEIILQSLGNRIIPGSDAMSIKRLMDKIENRGLAVLSVAPRQLPTYDKKQGVCIRFHEYKYDGPLLRISGLRTPQFTTVVLSVSQILGKNNEDRVLVQFPEGYGTGGEYNEMSYICDQTPVNGKQSFKQAVLETLQRDPKDPAHKEKIQEAYQKAINS